MGKILILSTERDAHIAFVTKHLRDDEYLRIDPVDILNGNTIDYRMSDGNLAFLYNGQPLDVKSIWFRRPRPLEKSMLSVGKKYADYSLSALDRHLEMITEAFPSAFWVSDVTAIRRAEKKLAQLTLAVKIGFNVPETIFASSAEQAEAFVLKHGRCIVKSQARTFPTDRLAFTKIVSVDDKLDYSNLYLDPFTFQQYVEPAYEVRVTVMGNQVFAAKVGALESDGINSPHRDWRVGFWNKSFTAEKTTLPAPLKKQCLQLVEDLKLAYGAIDLIVDKKGKAWFLEINPNGQWAFIEEKTREPMGKTLAHMLQVAHK